MEWSCLKVVQIFWRCKYLGILLLCVGLVFYVSVLKERKGTTEQEWEDHEVLPLLKLLPEEKYKSMFLFDGIWLAPKNRCECDRPGKLEIYQLENYIDKDKIASLTERREKEFRAFRRSGPCSYCVFAFLEEHQNVSSYKGTQELEEDDLLMKLCIRYPFGTKEAIIAQPNTPLSYPIQGAVVMPFHTIVIPVCDGFYSGLSKPKLKGLGFHGVSTEKHQVILKASFGTLDTLADISEDYVRGRGEKELIISTSHVKLLNHILEHVTYTSTEYLVDAVDVVSFSTGTHLVKFPVTIRQPVIPKLFDPGSDNLIRNLVTITTKTFLRHHKLRDLIKSLRQYYPDVKLIVADDSEHPEKIEETNVEQYIMPFGKGWFAGRNLAISQVTTKYYLWVDDDFLFTENTKIEKLVDVLENSDLDVVGGSVNGNRFSYKIYYEEGDESSCLHIRSGSFHHLEGFPNCVVTSAVVNFFLARTEESRRAGFDPKLQRVAHTEFFVDGLGGLRVGSCSDVSIGHQPHERATDPQLAEVEKTYSKFRRNTREQMWFKLALHYFKNRLKCFTKA